ncbi:MAG TPA: 23S rRNA (pseudouridine(1915)-N(3))-methyltransferase RlmH [Erysipelotrichaceae bacterium]|nr:23S rRNA (pseudouridine(1915)-N(3))-methyltransferase RlmH [Erysipelotrichaceae bacterium]
MIRIISCGRLKEKWMREGIAEYMKRIMPYEKIEMVEVDDEPAPQTNSDAENQQVKKIEGERLLRQIKPQEYVILLDLAGKEWTSPQMADYLDKLYTSGHSKIDFVIGGSLGLAKDVIARSDYRWKLSANTFPHQICRILTLEQIYRCFRILHHEPYHK